ncbi:MAG: hypothetical protein A3C36_05840 [Omnitrophica WOR_2 bacterium RIFCSPHIGHO2_02_FULL_52_10]|nr:MAG: hypothetical protein A3C36_05840 [Omnitrophica WOR_2 bacterium RIFCSPHIGHO2_02_FULL_52_10]
MFRPGKRGQTSLEYVVLLIIVIGSFVAVQNYMKRGIQGRWKSAVDDLGDQYDPRTAITDVRHTLSSTTNTTIITVDQPGGITTQRTDVSSSAERREGQTSVGAY